MQTNAKNIHEMTDVEIAAETARLQKSLAKNFIFGYVQGRLAVAGVIFGTALIIDLISAMVKRKKH